MLAKRFPSKLVRTGGPSNNTVFNPPTNLSKAYLEGLDDDVLLRKGRAGNNVKSNRDDPTAAAAHDGGTISDSALYAGKEQLVELLRGTGVTDIDDEAVRLLPTWEQVTDLYGDGPMVYGLEQCEAFREAVPSDQASVAPAGLFNTGTNVLSGYLENNCVFPNHHRHDHNTDNKVPPNSNAGGSTTRSTINTGLLWQVPWGKHYPASARHDHTTPSMTDIDKSTVLPIVLVRDPYTWMESMCRHPYSIRWHHNSRHCPNLQPTPEDIQEFAFTTPTVPVRIKYSDKDVYKWDSLAHLWSDWNRQYYDTPSYPRIMVRFEDLLFHPRTVTETLCACAGGELRSTTKFRYYVDSAKFGPGHGEVKTSLLTALIRYGHGHRRGRNMTQQDFLVARQYLDHELMETFHYNVVK